MTTATDENLTHLPLPKSLGTHRQIRGELVRLYKQGKAGRIDPPLLGRLVHLLNVLSGIITSTELEQRLARLEAAAADPDWPPAPPNGRDRHVEH